MTQECLFTIKKKYEKLQILIKTITVKYNRYTHLIYTYEVIYIFSDILQSYL